MVRDQIGTMVGDLIAETQRRVEAAGVESIDDVRGAGRPLAGFSPSWPSEERALKRFLYARLYNAPELVPVREEAQRVVANLPPPTAPIRACFPTAGGADEGETGTAARRSATSSPE